MRCGTATNNKNEAIGAQGAKGGASCHDQDGALLEAIRELPPAIQRVEIDAGAEDESFVSAAVVQLTALIDRKGNAA